MDYTPEWLKKIVDNLDAKVTEFFSYYEWLGDSRSKIPQNLYGEYADLINRGYSLQNKINSAKSFMSQAKSWLNSVISFGESGALSAFPLIPAAIVASGIAALALMSSIAYWVTDAVKFRSKLNAVIAAGGNAGDVIAAGQGQKGIFGNIESIVQWSVIGLAVYLFMSKGQ